MNLKLNVCFIVALAIGLVTFAQTQNSDASPDQNLSLDWQFCYPSKELNPRDFATDISQLADGSIVVSGRLDKDLNDSSVLFNMLSDKSIKWHYEFPKDTFIEKTIVTPEQEIIAFGNYKKNLSISELKLFKFNSVGKLLLETAPLDTNLNRQITDVVQSPTGNIYISGMQRNLDDSLKSIFMSKLSPTLHHLWTQTIESKNSLYSPRIIFTENNKAFITYAETRKRNKNERFGSSSISTHYIGPDGLIIKSHSIDENTNMSNVRISQLAEEKIIITFLERDLNGNKRTLSSLILNEDLEIQGSKKSYSMPVLVNNVLFIKEKHNSLAVGQITANDGLADLWVAEFTNDGEILNEKQYINSGIVDYGNAIHFDRANENITIVGKRKRDTPNKLGSCIWVAQLK